VLVVAVVGAVAAVVGAAACSKIAFLCKPNILFFSCSDKIIFIFSFYYKYGLN
jgi:hypothetical protein